VINGTKAFITNSGTDITELVTVTAVTGTTPAAQGDLLDHRAVPARRASRSPSRTRRSAGTPPTPTSCRSPTAGCRRTNLLGERGRGYASFLSILDEGRIAIAALGRARPGLRRRVACRTPGARRRSAADRRVPGDPVQDRGHGDAGAPARLAYSDAARGCCGRRPFKREAAIAKLYSSEAAVTNAREATQVFGGYGFMNEFPVARHWRTRRSSRSARARPRCSGCSSRGISACPSASCVSRRPLRLPASARGAP
jgi:butyryl-CoA dehydrogenase